MSRDISRLRRRIARLEGKAAPTPQFSSIHSADSADSFKTAGDDRAVVSSSEPSAP